jgi:hypothetical protein
MIESCFVCLLIAAQDYRSPLFFTTKTLKKCKVPKVTLPCHPEPPFLLSQESRGAKDLANEREILRFAQNDSFAGTLAHSYFLEASWLISHTIYRMKMANFPHYLPNENNLL